MTTVWISDFRGKQIQYCINEEDTDRSNTYIIEDTAEYSWFNSTITAQLALLSLDEADVVIMLGFNDCVYSCTWNTFDIDKIANSYIETVNSLIEQYPAFNFYFCSINPINGSYPFAEYSTNIIPLDLLDTKIKYFNNKISESCNATYIDSYSYFTSTAFDTYDGIRYNMDTYNYLKSYIENNFKVEGGVTFTPRLTEPDPNSEEYLYWTHTDASGYNECVKVTGNSVLPNCVGYAWGRFYEISNTKPTLSKGNAELWYQNDDGYERGDIPKLGAVICWRHGSIGDDAAISGVDAGHVAIVEEIDGDTITISESAYGGFKDGSQFKTRQLEKGTSTDKESWWFYANNYYFQGFIYNPAVTSTSGTASQSEGQVTKDDVTSSNESISGVAQENNARYIWQYFGSKGWSLNAVAGMLGNMQHESAINPGRWQGGNVNVGPAFGLVQWDPFTKYTGWCEANGLAPGDMDSALLRIEAEIEASQTSGWQAGLDQWITTDAYPISFIDFTTSIESPRWLAEAFVANYERCSNLDKEKVERGDAAEYWYNFLLPYAPGFGKTFKVINFKIDTISTTSVKASFVVTNGASGYYKLFDSYGNLLNTVNLNIETLDEPSIITFVQPGLVPNTDYSLFIEVASEDESSKKEITLNFHTLQDFPMPIDSLNLELSGELSNNPLFKLSSILNDKWGYWKPNGYGYDLQLIINGKCIEEKSVNNVNISEFKLEDYFKNYNIAIDDIIQIGVRAWTLDNNRNKVYDGNFINKSNSICLLQKPIIMYLNIK